LNNLIFIGLAIIVWWGTHYPLITEAIAGEKIIVGPPFFEQTTAPLWAVIILLMGVAPLLPWRRTSLKKVRESFLWPGIVAVITMILLSVIGITIPGAILGFGLCAFTVTTIVMEYWRGVRVRHHRGDSYPVALQTLIARNRRRYGGYMIHMGIILVAIGVIGTKFYQTETQQNIAVGETMSITSELLGTYSLTYQGLRDGESPDDRLITEAVLDVTHDGQPLGELVPIREYFVVQQQPMTIPDKMITTMLSDVYVILAGWEGTGETATFKVFINPLVNWLWIGGIVFILGTLVAVWPTPEPKRISSSVKLPGAVASVG
jgi:cytochrome c-type biogenesis protein CcmF